MYRADESPYSKLDIIPTGLSKLDRITGIGGIPTRKITEISGVYSVGKTTLALSIIKQAQALKMDCLYADSEFSFDEKYAESLGVSLRKLDLIQERFAEDTLDAIETWAESHKKALICLDSVGGLLSRQEAEKDASGRVIGGQAKLIATFCRKIVPILAINNIALVMLNHSFVDLMSGRLKTSGGMKLEYAKSLHIALKKMPKRVMKSDTQIGDVIEAEIKKNKLSSTLHQKAELILLYGEGFSAEADKMEELLESGRLKKTGNTYSLDGNKIAVGQTAVREYLKANDV